MSKEGNKVAASAETGRGRFFAVEAAAWARVCQHRNMNLAVAYLVLARGSHFGTRHSSWSVNAIEGVTNIARPRAKLAIEGLEAIGAIEVLRGGTRPLYRLRTAHELAGRPLPPVLSEKERAILAKVEAAGEPVAVAGRGSSTNGWPSGNLRAAVERMISVHALHRDGAGLITVGSAMRDRDPPKLDWVWLPNSIVDGLGATSPVEQIRQTGVVETLRMFVDLYHAQSLAADGGIHWRQVRVEFKRMELGRRGPFVIWGFEPANLAMWPTAPFIAPYLSKDPDCASKCYYPDAVGNSGWNTVFRAFERLDELNLVEFVVHIIDADTDEGEILHPYALYGTGEGVEFEITVSANEASARLLSPEALKRAEDAGLYMLPALQHLTQIQAVGLLRLRHRARTSATARWLSQTDLWAEWVRKYDQVGQKSERSQHDATSKNLKGR